MQLTRLISLFIFPVSALPWFDHSDNLYEDVCKIDGRAFTGVRVLNVRHFSLPLMRPLDKEIVLLGCDLGSAHYTSTVEPESVFNRSIEMISQNTPGEIPGEIPGEKVSYVHLSRRPSYANPGHTKLKFIPGTVIGGVYLSETANKNNSSDWLPLSPLIADSWDQIWTHYNTRNGSAEVLIITSLLRSPDILDKTYPRNNNWAQHIPLNEP